MTDSPSSPALLCYVCGIEDPDAFNEAARKSARGEYDKRNRNQMCRDCRREYFRKYRAARKEEMRAKAREYMARPEIKAKRKQYASKRYGLKTTGRRRQFRVELAPGLPRMPRTWERVEREGALKWWERESGYQATGMSLRGAVEQWPEGDVA